jgi:hypothetical protein
MLLPHVGGNWNNGADAGVFGVNLNNNSLQQSPSELSLAVTRTSPQ